MARLRTRLDFPVSKRSTKRSITIADHKTSISLENEFWDCLKEIAVERDVSLGALVAAIEANRQHAADSWHSLAIQGCPLLRRLLGAKRKCCERHDFDAPDPSATSARNFAVMHSSVIARRCDNVAASSPRRAAREAT
jgi:predicted DNA-binding ribbon-helix-helix protein